MRIDGEVDRPCVLDWPEAMALCLPEETMQVNCYGGLRDIRSVRPLPLVNLFEAAQVREGATGAVFLSADGYYDSCSLLELLQQEAYLAYPGGGQVPEKIGLLPRLVIPGKYGYRLAKWVQLVRLVAGEPEQWLRAAMANTPSLDGAAGASFPLPPPFCAIYLGARKSLRRQGNPV